MFSSWSQKALAKGVDDTSDLLPPLRLAHPESAAILRNRRPSLIRLLPQRMGQKKTFPFNTVRAIDGKVISCRRNSVNRFAKASTAACSSCRSEEHTSELQSRQ